MIPDKALRYIKQKELKPAFSYEDVWNEEHITSFTVAKVMNVNILEQMKNAVERAIERGETVEQFKKNLLPTLYKAGWTGMQKIIDEKTGEEKEVYIDTPRRLKTIYETNLRSAYMKGRFDRAYESDAHPYLMYRVGPSKVHRPEHLEWDGLILDKNDPFWLSHNPPNGWGCKCYTVAVSKGRKERYEKHGIPTPTADNITIQIKAKTKAPKTIYKTYINKRNGTISKVPVGVDPSFNFNQGNYSRDLVVFDDFMRKAKKSFPERFEAIAETILRNEIKKEQFESWIEKAYEKPKIKEDGTEEKSDRGRNMTAIGFINTLVKNKLMQLAGVDIGESVTIGLRAGLLNGIKAKRHAKKGEAIEKKDAKYIIDCILDGNVYLQKNNDNILYLYKIEEDRYLQVTVSPLFVHSKKRSSIQIPTVRNIQFLNDKQVTSKYKKGKLLDLIK